MTGEPVVAAAGRGLREVIRYVAGALLGIVVLILLFGKRGELLAAWRQLGQVDLNWVAVAVLAEALSLWMFAYLQQRVLRLSGTRVTMPGLYLLSLANDAIANTVPGEPAVSSAYRYRYYRRQGASSASAGWTIFTILIAQAIGMSLLLLVGVLIALAGSTGSGATGATVAGLIIVVGAGAILVRRDLVLRLASALVGLVRRITGHPRGNLGARIEATLARMREIPLSRAATVGVVVIATLTWSCDFVCLVCAFRAVHAAIPWDGVLLAYGVAQVVGSFPIVPGGLGIVEGSLAVILSVYGAGRVEALSAALVFRLVNFWLAILLGWLTVGLIAQLSRRAGQPADAEAPADPAAGPEVPAVGFSPPD
jgi:putative heme transporter